MHLPFHPQEGFISFYDDLNARFKCSYLLIDIDLD